MDDVLPVGRRTTRLLRRLGPVAGAPLLLPLVLLAPMWLVAALTRWLRRLPWLEPDITDRNLVEFLPEVGARPRPHLDTYSKAQDVFRLHTDAEGWRGRATVDDADVVVVGDSFAFGYGVDEHEVFTELDGDQVMKAVASPAYSMVHGLLWMRRLGERLRGRHVVWLVYTGNDLTDNLYPDLGTYRMPFVRARADGGWEVVTDHVSPEPWTFGGPPRPNRRLFAELATPGHYSDRVFGAAAHLVAEAARTCAAVDASLALVTTPPAMLVCDPDGLRRLGATPERVDLDLPDRRLADLARQQGLPFVPLGPQLRPEHYFQDDMHWNAAGHRVAAAAIRRASVLLAT